MNWKNGRCRDSMIYDNVHEKKPQKTTYTKMYTIFRGKYGIVWHYKTPQQNIKSRFYGIVARIGIV